MTRGTISQKIIARAAGCEEVEVGEIVTVRVDLAMANDITAPLAIKQMEAAGAQRVFDPERICIVAGRHAPFRDIAFAEMVHDLGEWCRGQGIGSFYDNGEGMDHALVPELGLARPGMMICNADSHACTLGALGAFAVAMGSTDMAYIFAFGETWLMVPPTIRVVYRGRVGPYVGSKDLILAALGRLGIDGARYKAVEFAGSAVSALSMDERFTLTNMAIEMGGKVGLIEPDDRTHDYLASRTDQPYEAVHSDPDAALESVVEIDVDGMPPLVARPHLPSNVAPVSEVAGTKVTQVTIGTCTNGRLIDLEQAAEVLKGRKVAKGVRLLVTPATEIVYRAALKAGLIETFIDSGAIVNPPGCGPCAGIHQAPPVPMSS